MIQICAKIKLNASSTCHQLHIVSTMGILGIEFDFPGCYFYKRNPMVLAVVEA